MTSVRADSTALLVPGRRRSRWRTVAFFAITLGLLLGITEAVVRGVFRSIHPRLTLEMLVSQEKETASPTTSAGQSRHYEVVHPYVGFVVNPALFPGFNRYGFLQVDGPILKRRPGLVIVAVTGGSVARDLCGNSATTLKQRLRDRLGPVEIAVVCLAQEGFKQPQQLMTWAYFQSLGAEFDYLINLDGFNEVALYATETQDDGCWYAYPRAWETRLTDTSNPELNRLIGQGANLKDRRRAWAQKFTGLQGVPSMAIHATWNAGDESFRRQIAEVSTKIQKAVTASQKQFSHAGPVEKFANESERRAALVDLWERNSVSLEQMCRGVGTRYLHRLQPNISLDSWKVLTEREKELAQADAPYRKAARAGYPELLARGPKLREDGVDFEELTQLFAGVKEAVYSDDCCHMTRLGYDLIAARLAEGVAAVATSH